MTIKTPEVFLKSFNNRILNLLNSVEILDNTEINKSLRLIYRKLSISELLFEKYIISISGLQGIGKTTLLKQIYGIPDDILPENIGRGEQLPVLITESDISEISLNVSRLKEINERFITVSESIEKEEFFKISKNPDPSDLILELKVPNKIFNSENKSFLLLPGFEGTQNDREDLVYHSLISSATCLFLFNESACAKESNKNILDEINTKFEKAKPIFITTFSDTSIDENESLKNNLIEKFNLHNEEDRVICVGTGKYKDTDKNRMDDWLPKLVESLSKYSQNTSQFRKSQIINLRNLIDDELGQILEAIEEVNDRKDLKADLIFIKKIKEPLEVMDKQIKSIRKKYIKVLDEKLVNFTDKPIKKIKENIRDESGWKKTKKMLVGKSMEDIIIFENAISDYWNNSNGYGMNELHTIVLNNLLTNGFPFHNNLEIENPQIEKKLLLGDFSQPENSNCAVSEETVNDVSILFSPKKIDLQFSEKLNHSIKTLPLLYLEFIRIGGINPQLFDLGKHNLSSEDKIKEVFGDTDFLQSKANLILPGIFAILGIDAIDGEIDSVTALSSALGVKSTIIAGTLLTGAGLIGAGIMVKSIITQINKAEIEDAEMAKTIIYGLKDRYYAYYISLFDDMMDDLISFVMDKLYERYHVDKAVSRNEYLIKTIADVKEDRYNLNQLLNRQILL
jgi:hypothetical protein